MITITQGITLYHGDALEVMRGLPSGSVDAVVTDPPYSSGGAFRGDRLPVTSVKYQQTGTQKVYPEFHGDTRDQRSYLKWSERWMQEARRVTRPGGYLFSFIDWRLLPTLTDAVQVAGWVWRGILPWDKTEASRPQRGWFRNQAEFVILGTNGPRKAEVDVYAPGCFRFRAACEEKHHITGKPVALMKALMSVLPEGSKILDPFAGSGSTLLAAEELGMSAIGVESVPDYCEIIRDRFRRAA